ncbi:hypothetical protein LQ236_002518 [Nitrospina gracilis]|nr:MULTISPECIES: hypothetical protein [Nitrospina]MCF8724498.1 hypothetical protein [Nitrospina sp. Nb-3]
MDNVDEKIDTLMRDKLVSLMQENTVRIKNINIKYTTSNKKHTIERWRAFYDSFDKMFRLMPRELVRVEKEVRSKFVQSMGPERKLRLLSYINSEADLLFEKLEKECRQDFKKLGEEAEFEERLEKTRAKFTDNLETQLQKCMEALETETSASGKLPISELCRMYDLNEGFLHELNLIDPLQKIQLRLKEAASDSELQSRIEDVKEALKRIAHSLQSGGPKNIDSASARKGHKMVVARETMALRDLVINTNYLLEYALVPDEYLNSELANKLYRKVESFFDTGRHEWKPEAACFKAVYEYALVRGQHHA